MWGGRAGGGDEGGRDYLWDTVCIHCLIMPISLIFTYVRIYQIPTLPMYNLLYFCVKKKKLIDINELVGVTTIIVSTFLTFMEPSFMRLDTDDAEPDLLQMCSERRRSEKEVKRTCGWRGSHTWSSVACVADTVIFISILLLRKFQANHSWCLKESITNSPTA